MDDIRARVSGEIKTLIIEYSPEADLEITEATTLEEFGLDSIDLMEIAFKLEEIFSVEIQPEKLKDFSNFRDFVDFVASEIPQA